MGWWKNDDGEVVGDDTVDAVARDLAALAEAVGRKLPLPELLGYLHAVLAAKSGDLLATPQAVPPLVAEVVRFGEDEDTTETIAMAAADGVGIRQRIDAMCGGITALYEAFVERRPTLGEMLESVRFPLGSRPDEFVDLPADASVRTIRAG